MTGGNTSSAQKTNFSAWYSSYFRDLVYPAFEYFQQTHPLPCIFSHYALSSSPNKKLGDEIISTKSEHKHLGLILDSKLNFKSHIREAVVKVRRGIGLLKYLSKYVSKEVLDQIYKLYVRPHLDYGDIIYHKHDPDKQLNFTE